MSNLITEPGEVVQDPLQLDAIDLDRLFIGGGVLMHSANSYTEWTGFAFSDETACVPPVSGAGS